MNNTISRRSFLSAAAAVSLPRVGAVGIAAESANAARSALPAIPILRMIANRRPVEGMLKALTAVLPTATEPPQSAAYQINQISQIMLHIDTMKRSGIEFHDLSESALETLESSAIFENTAESFNAPAALYKLQTLSQSGCHDWRDIVKYLAEKAMPLLKDLENGTFTSLAQSSGTDGGVLASIQHITKEFETMLGPEFDSFKSAYELSSRTLSAEWENALQGLIHFDQEKFLPTAPTRMPSLETGDQAKAPARPESFYRKYEAEPLFLPHNKNHAFFRITTKEGEHLTFMDICRLSKQLAPSAHSPVQWPRQGGKDGLVISTDDMRLIAFLSSCRPPAATADSLNAISTPPLRP